MSNPNPAALLTIDAAAERLSVTPRMIGKLLKSGELPRIKIGRATRIAPEALAAYLESNTCAS